MKKSMDNSYNNDDYINQIYSVFFQAGMLNSVEDYMYVIMQDAIDMGMVKVSFDDDLPNDIGTKQLVVLFNEWHKNAVCIEYLEYLKKHYNARTVLVIRNRIEDKHQPALRGIPLHALKASYSLIITTEKSDAAEFGLLYHQNPFSRITTNGSLITDLCYFGTDKGRGNLLRMIAQEAMKHGVKCNIHMVGSCQSDKDDNGVINGSYCSYRDILKIVSESNCILEILQHGQTSSTLRYQESVCMGKKLLTNNPNIVIEKYYNPCYMEVYSNPHDINWQFVKERVIVNYGYEEDYSPIRFLKRIYKELGL